MSRANSFVALTDGTLIAIDGVSRISQKGVVWLKGQTEPVGELRSDYLNMDFDCTYEVHLLPAPVEAFCLWDVEPEHIEDTHLDYWRELLIGFRTKHSIHGVDDIEPVFFSSAANGHAGEKWLAYCCKLNGVWMSHDGRFFEDIDAARHWLFSQMLDRWPQVKFIPWKIKEFADAGDLSAGGRLCPEL